MSYHSEALGWRYNVLGLFLRRKRVPNLNDLYAILAYFPDARPDWLLFGKEPRRYSEMEPYTEAIERLAALEKQIIQVKARNEVLEELVEELVMKRQKE